MREAGRGGREREIKNKNMWLKIEFMDSGQSIKLLICCFQSKYLKLKERNGGGKNSIY